MCTGQIVVWQQRCVVQDSRNFWIVECRRKSLKGDVNELTSRGDEEVWIRTKSKVRQRELTTGIEGSGREEKVEVGSSLTFSKIKMVHGGLRNGGCERML